MHRPFEVNVERLQSFIRLLLRRRKYAFAFRHASWYCEDICKLLRRHDIALCISDHRDAPAPWVVTARYVYFRGHGLTGAYKSHYSTATLQALAQRIVRWRRQGRTVYAYFDNDQKSAAPADALRLGSVLRRHFTMTPR